MSSGRDKRRATVREAPRKPAGYRQNRRRSRARKKAEQAQRAHQRAVKVDRSVATVKRVAIVAGMFLGGAMALVLFLLVLAMGINSLARWNAARVAANDDPDERIERQAEENLLLIGVTEGRAIGFLATRIDPEQGQIFGIAIPDGAFIEVPGQGFERIGDSFTAGPQTSLDAVANFLTVPFRSYAVVPEATYQQALQSQSLAGVMASVIDTNLQGAKLSEVERRFEETDTENIALVALPVKPISLGSQTYFEPQRGEIADLLKSWWGIDIADVESVIRVIVYNGSGVPGIAGQAAQQLIRGGMRVVDTKNADRFDYETTQVVWQSGSRMDAERVREVLGTGEIVDQPSEQDVANVIVIIGSDYVPRDSAQ